MDQIITRVKSEEHKEVMMLKITEGKKSFSEVLRMLLEEYKKSKEEADEKL